MFICNFFAHHRYFLKGLNDKVRKEVWDAIKLLESHGAKYREISLPSTDKGIAAYYLISASEALAGP